MIYFITAINTNSGKTLASAIVTECLKADYWKPVQTGQHDSDTNTVRSLLTNTISQTHPERYHFQLPVSPHSASKSENCEISLHDFDLPPFRKDLVIEGAGGILVPLNDKGDYIIDLARKFEAEIILVSNFYLGSINHTLLTVNELQKQGLAIRGLIFNGEYNVDSAHIITKLTGLPVLLHIPQEPTINKEVVSHYAHKLKLF